ncbi:MAG: hypothetical protein QF652_05350 [Dehalococcoidia bacterium]|nr:hypothetical protein [Dehalococcoidia bacterium]
MNLQRTPDASVRGRELSFLDFDPNGGSTEAPDFGHRYNADMEIQLAWPVP